MEDNICIIYNTAQLYREGIWEELSTASKFNFNIFCDYNDRFGVKQIEKNKIIAFNKKTGYLKIYPEIKNLYFRKLLFWQKNSIKLLFSKKYSIYIILGDAYCLSNWIILFVSKLLNKKVVVWTHGLYGRESDFIKFIRLAMISLSSSALIYNNYSKNLISKYINPKKLFVVNNSLNHKTNNCQFKKLLSKFSNQKKATFTICFSGRLTKRKRLEDVFKAIKILNQEGINVNFIIVGKGPEKNRLVSCVNALGVSSNITFKGEVYGDNVNEIIFNSDLSISPGHIGLFAIHSMSFGTPVLTHNNFKYQSPEFEAIIPGITGDFYIHQNIGDLVKKIKFWYINNNKSENRKNCLKRIESFYTPSYQKKIIIKSINYAKKI